MLSEKNVFERGTIFHRSQNNVTTQASTYHDIIDVTPTDRINELMLTKVVLIKLWHVVSYERTDVFMLFITYETEGVCRNV